MKAKYGGGTNRLFISKETRQPACGAGTTLDPHSFCLLISAKIYHLGLIEKITADSHTVYGGGTV